MNPVDKPQGNRPSIDSESKHSTNVDSSNKEVFNVTVSHVPTTSNSTKLSTPPSRTPFSPIKMLFFTTQIFIDYFRSNTSKESRSPRTSQARTSPNPSESTDTCSIELTSYNSSDNLRPSSIDSEVSSISKSSSAESETLTNSSKADFRASAKEFYDFSKFSEGKIILTKDQESQLGVSDDQGGHGGTLKGPLQIGEETQQVFLKPFDGVEAKNYELIQEHAPSLASFMPKTYGLATDTKGRNFLIMENTRLGKDEQGNSKDLKQYGDIKIAGKIKGLHNLICDQGEMQTTRGKAKSFFDYMQMKKGAENAPGFMFYKDSSFLGKAGRLFNFKKSEDNLHQKLMTASPNKENIGNLITELRSLKSALENSPIALIGGSIIIVENEKGELKPKLIDPAHVQYDPKLKSSIEGDTTHIYFGDETTFENRKLSNIQGLNDLCNALENLKSKLAA